MRSPSRAAPLSLPWRFAELQWELGAFPKLMGILNVTPDSFSDGGRFLSVAAAVEHGLQLAADGADLLDVGGESTRPGAAPTPVEEELRRVVPVIEQLSRQTVVPLSIDTMKSAVAREALQAGARIVNDVSAAEHDPEMAGVWAGSRCGVILMHMQGRPPTMQADPRYQDVVAEVGEYLAERVRRIEQAGVDPLRIVIDPGVGFGKTPEHNLEILTHVGEFRKRGRPVLIGHSRKRFLYKLLGRETDERLAGTIGVAIALAMQSVDLLRVHDVSTVRDALRAWKTIVEANNSATL